MLTVLGNTAQFALGATLVGLAIGLPIAWLTERTTLPGKAFVYALMTLGLLIPGIYTAMGWTFVAHPRIGFVNSWLRGAFGADGPTLDVTTPLGMAFVQGMSVAPLAFILTVQTFASMNPSLEEAARAHGMSLFRTLRRVTLPLAWPGILAAEWPKWMRAILQIWSSKRRSALMSSNITSRQSTAVRAGWSVRALRTSRATGCR